ncbi:MAG: hypothetical protein L0154_24385 [Chloroflexi bacterium]|nr:hypothetical protein [Chloroflexota bacterium]
MTTEYFAQLDFENQIRGHYLRQFVKSALGQSNRLTSFERALEDVRVKQIIDRGVQTIAVDQIGGSYTDNRSFDADFRPAHKAVEYRWVRVRQAHYEDVLLPAIAVYQVGDTYFVEDGHHRVSVARAIGQTYIDAHVREVITD